MKYIFTEHIKDRMKQRGLSRKEIIATVKNPDIITESPTGKRIARKQNVKVIYIEEDSDIILITAYKI